MKLKIVIFVCGLFLQFMTAESEREQNCEVNDFRTLFIHVSQMGLELQEYKERTSSLEKRLEEMNGANKAMANDLNSTLQHSGLLNIGEVINKLTALVENQTEDQKALKGQSSSLEEKLEEMSAAFKAYKAQTNELNSTLHTDLLSMEERIKELTASLENQTEDLKILGFNISALQVDRAVGFLATSSNHTPCSGILQFERSVVNVGNAYNASNGYFTAPYSASYQFKVEECLGEHTQLPYEITSPSRGVFNHTQHKKPQDSCSTLSTVGYLSKGEQVYVYCNRVDSLEGTHDDDDRTTFSGADSVGDQERKQDDEYLRMFSGGLLQ